jgi:hypothetical protein
VEVGNAVLGLGRRFTSVEVGYVCVANVLLVCPYCVRRKCCAVRATV